MPCTCCSQQLTCSLTYTEAEQTHILILVARRRDPTNLSRGNWQLAKWLVREWKRLLYSSCRQCTRDEIIHTVFHLFFFLDLFDSTLFVNKVLQSLMPISQTTGEIIDSNHRRSVRTECNFNWVLLIVHAAARKNMMMLISYKKTNSSHYSAVNK